MFRDLRIYVCKVVNDVDRLISWWPNRFFMPEIRHPIVALLHQVEEHPDLVGGAREADDQAEVPCPFCDLVFGEVLQRLRHIR